MTDNSCIVFFKQLCKNCHAPNQIATHRDGNLMYYAYIHKKDESEIYGICIVCGEVCLNLKWLYVYLQQTLEAAANKGILFHYDQYGRISINIERLYSEAAEIDYLFREIKEYANKQQSYWDALPPEDFSISKDSKITFAFNDDNTEKITDAIRHYHNVIVSLDNTAPSSFARTIERLNSENRTLKEEKNILESAVESLKETKTQYKWVIILSISVVLGLIVILLFNQNVRNLQQKVSAKEYFIDSLNNVVSDKENIIYNQKQEIKEVNINLQTAKQELTESKKIIEDVSLHMPVYASNIEVKNEGEEYGEKIYSNRTTYIYTKLTVYSLIDASIDLYIRFYRPDGSLSRSSTAEVSPIGFSYKDTAYLSKNQNTTVYLSGWGRKDKGYWKSGTYRIEVWYNDICLKSKSFTIL